MLGTSKFNGGKICDLQIQGRDAISGSSKVSSLVSRVIRSIHSVSLSTGFPATLTKLIQYLFPEKSGRLCPRCVPARLTDSPFGRQRTSSQTTSSSLKLGQP
mmetsp:Transcript_9755/g.14672  ORF Transcript_9755/g.14672 Transcript_9755/m.14672 type:complete len:102 (+) Transcript_9755:101-406(+)